MIPEHYLFGSLFYTFIDRLFYKTALEVHTLYIRPSYSSSNKSMISYLPALSCRRDFICEGTAMDGRQVPLC